MASDALTPEPPTQATTEVADHTPGFPRGLQWWPTLVGIAFAAFVASDLFFGEESGPDLAPIVTASGLVYLAASSLRMPRSAWPVFLLGGIIITLASVGVIDFDATWPMLALAALFLGYGLVRGFTKPFSALPLQLLAMIGFGAVAVAAIYIQPTAGAYLVAAGLLAHAGWDVYHHRMNRVVVRSLAEFCVALDTILAIAIVAAILQG